MKRHDIDNLKVGDKIYSFMKMTKSILTYEYQGEGRFKSNGPSFRIKELTDNELEQFSINLDDQYIELYKLEKEELEKKIQWHKDQLIANEDKLKNLEKGYGYLKEDYPEHFI